MDRTQLRAAARAAARDARLAFETRTDPSHLRGKSRDAVVPDPTLLDVERARSRCSALGKLESIVVSQSPNAVQRTLYLVVPDPAMKPQYERQGLELTAECRVLVDAQTLRPLAVLSMTDARGERMPPPQENSPIGFNPYFDVRSV
jgi:hypothetical protein